jgi:DNA repair exonuclease SbcCD ATPase subunit
MEVSEIEQELTALQHKFLLESGKQQALKEESDDLVKQLITIHQDSEAIEKAQTRIQVVAKATQEGLRYYLGDLVSLAMEEVFPEPYGFDAEFVIRRNKTEVDLWFVREGKKLSPLDDAGGGAVDVAAFALRVSLWSLANPRTRPVIILDEPFRFLSKGLQPLASKLLKELSERLGLQFIMVSHSEDLIEGADRVFVLKNEHGVSMVDKMEEH